MVSRTRSRRAPVSSDKRFRKISGEGGTPERWQHSGRELVPTERAGIVAVRATEEHVLDVLSLKNLLNALQVEAGLRLKADFHDAALAAHVTGSYSGMSNGGDYFRGEYERNPAQEAAYRRWRGAVRELGQRCSAAVVATACYDEAPMLADLAALQDGLTILACWYRR